MQMLVSSATQRNTKPHNVLWRVALASTGTKSSLVTQHNAFWGSIYTV